MVNNRKNTSRKRKRRCSRRGGSSVTPAPYQSYNIPGGSPQKAAMLASQQQRLEQQRAIAHSGGKKTRKRLKNKKRKVHTRKHKKRHGRRCNCRCRKKCRCNTKRKCKCCRKKRRKTRINRIKRGGNSVTVPSFPMPAGGPVGPDNANTASQKGNGTLTQAGANAQYDHVDLVGSPVGVQTGGKHARSGRGRGRSHYPQSY